MDQTLATMLSLLDTRLKALEVSGKVRQDLLDDLEERVERLEEHDLDLMLDRVNDLAIDVDNALSRIEELR